MASPAFVLGDVDLVRSLGLAGIPSVLFAQDGDRARWSRHVVASAPWVDHWAAPEALVDAVERRAAVLTEPPVVLPQTDGDLLAVSRHRDRLARTCRLLLADPELIEDLVDKRRFAVLAERLALPVPRTRRVILGGDDDDPGDLRFPLVLKPLTRRADRWHEAQKALAVPDAAALDAARRRLDGLEVLLQEAIAGDERRIESYHAYVDAGGRTAAEFTGRKVRTWPAQYGISTAVELTAQEDVVAAGRDVFARLGLRGVAKADFKRAPDGGLHLLEVNPRFTLWHHLAAVAGPNIPAMVVADLTGAPHPAARPLLAGARWCDPLPDLRAARAAGWTTRRWTRWAAGCAAVSGVAVTDPAPLLRGVLWPPLRRRATRLLGS